MKTKTAKYPSEQLWLSSMHIDVMEKLAYFQVFSFPLKLKEIQNLTHHYYSQELLLNVLNDLVSFNKCYSHNGYYAVGESIKEECEKRLKTEKVAERFFKRLRVFVWLISRFPFVRGVAISGSLSKGVIHEKGDIDYFIITKNGKLWLTRGLLILFKKVFLLNSRKYFCVNYLIGDEYLEIQDKNLFTATEINYLLPVYNEKLFKAFRKANDWTYQYYGHFMHPIKMEILEGNPWYKKIFEFLLSGKMGNQLDKFCMQLCVNRWKFKFNDFDQEKFELTMRSAKNVSKHHPSDFQTMVLEKQKNNLELLLKNTSRH